MSQLMTPEIIWQALNDVKDPEIPVISVVEMGIVREVSLDGGGVTVEMTPTFSGCPALSVMQRDIKARIRQLGIESVKVVVVLSPPWSSDWISDEAREKLRQFGLAPPPKHGGQLRSVAFLDAAICPRCASADTIIKNSFGSTLCRMIWYCRECQDAFEQFKPLWSPARQSPQGFNRDLPRTVVSRFWHRSPPVPRRLSRETVYTLSKKLRPRIGDRHA